MEINHDCANKNTHHNHGGKRRGPSSYWMQDASQVFDPLSLKPGSSFLDLGCGSGDFSIHAAQLIGDTGIVYALDRSELFFNEIKQEIAEKRLTNIKTMVADITLPLNLKDKSVDVCMVSNVLHTIRNPEDQTFVFREIARILKPTGQLAVIECKAEESPTGPPLHMRLSESKIEHRAVPCGLRVKKHFDLGKNYMILFSLKS